jgi:hypothetical protein
MSRYLKKTLALLLLVTLLVSCNRTERLNKLKEEETNLMRELQHITRPSKWHILKEKSIIEIKDFPPAADQQLYLAKEIQKDLKQAQYDAEAGNIKLQEKVARLLQRVKEEAGFKAKNAEQATESLAIWIALLENIRRQQKLTKVR